MNTGLRVNYPLFVPHFSET